MGNKSSVFATMGARNYARDDRQVNDYYATDPKVVSCLLEVEKFSPIIWECACGEGHISKELERNGYKVISTDLIDRGYGKQLDFLETTAPPSSGLDIITNPPYSHALEFVQHSLDLLEDGHKVAMLLKIQFLEGKSRRLLFDKSPPKVVYVSTSRLNCAKNGNFNSYKSSAMCYAWFVWVKSYIGDTIVRWIN